MSNFGFDIACWGIIGVCHLLIGKKWGFLLLDSFEHINRYMKLTKMSFDTKCYSIILSLQPQKVTKIGNAVLRDIEEES